MNVDTYGVTRTMEDASAARRRRRVVFIGTQRNLPPSPFGALQGRQVHHFQEEVGQSDERA
jgi:hypothetical protein